MRAWVMILLIIGILLLASCSTTSSAAVISMPDAPDAPQINRPEQMDEADRRALADFYRRYAVYKDKVAAWKKRYK